MHGGADVKSAIWSMYPLLIGGLPIDSLMSTLRAKNVVTSSEQQTLEQMNTRRSKVTHLLNSIIIPSLQTNQLEKFDLLLEAMKEPNNLICKSLATELDSKLERRSISSHPKAKPPSGKL